MKQLFGISLILWMVWTPITCWAKVPLCSTATASMHVKACDGLWGGDDDDDDGTW